MSPAWVIGDSAINIELKKSIGDGSRARRTAYKNLDSPTFLHCKSSNGEQIMQYQLGALMTCAALFVYVFLRRRRRLSVIRDVPGPMNLSWIFGMSPEGQSNPFHLVL